MQSMIEACCADMQAVFDRDPACDKYSQCMLYFKGFQAVQSHRIANWLWKKGRKVSMISEYTDENHVLNTSQNSRTSWVPLSVWSALAFVHNTDHIRLHSNYNTIHNLYTTHKVHSLHLIGNLVLSTPAEHKEIVLEFIKWPKIETSREEEWLMSFISREYLQHSWGQNALVWCWRGPFWLFEYQALSRFKFTSSASIVCSLPLEQQSWHTMSRGDCDYWT